EDFVIGDKTFKVNVRQNQMETIFCASGMALMARNNTTDVVEVKRENGVLIFVTQTTADDTITIYNSKDGTTKTQDVKGAGKHIVRISVF
ncbi:MAG: hypothetical protein RR141_01290, partial [Rikenellaceae bacterium]